MQDRPTFGAERAVSTQWQHRRRSGVSQLLALAVALSIVVVGVGGVSPTVANAATPAFVQARANEVVSGTSNAVAFSSANTAGNLIAAYVIWSNVGGVSLADSRGNTYTAATARTTWGNSWSAQVFYAKSIAGGANTVTATFGTAISSFGIVYLHEYSGLNKVNPVDVTASAIGSSAAMSSGAVSTTNASDLLFGAGASMNAVTAAGTGFTTRSSAFDNRTEDRVVTSTGSYAATATQNSNAWVMQLVAFRADPGTSDSTPPTVALTAPANGATVSGTVNVTANANDNVAVASVQFLLDGNALGASDTTSPYSVSWDTTTATNGTHTLTARAADTTGNATTSAAVTVTVTNTDSTPPTVSITAPANGATVSGTVNVTANANDNVAVASVQFLLDNTALGAPDTTSPYSVTWDTTTATTGTHTLTARATDTTGNTTTSATVNITVTTTQGGATPAFVQARANEVVSGTSNAVAFSSANTAGNLIAAYVIWSNVGGVSLADSRGNTYTAATARTTWGNSWSAQVFYAKSIAGGANTVTATFGTAISSFGIVYLHEYSGLNKVNPVDVTASAIGSSAAMSSGAVSTTNASDLLFGAGASMNAVTAAGTGFTTRSSAFDNRTEDRVVTSTGPYAATATQNSNAWVMQLVAFRADPGTSDSTPPTVALTAPANGATVSGTVNVTANANDNVAVASVQFLLDNTALGASDTTSPYSVSWDTTTGTNGTHTLTARATDTTGNATTSAAVTVTVTNTDSTPPTVSITAPANGATVSGTVNVTANANDNVAVASVQFLLDNTALGAPDTTSPYSVTWDTTTATTGTHTLTARATDTTGNTTTSATVNITVTTPVISAGPVAEYPFNEGTGTTAADASGDSLNGTLVNGPTWAAGKYGSAVNFDGDNDYVDLGNPAALQMTGSVTISGWINSASFPSGDSAIVSTKSTDNTGYQLDTTIDNGPRTVGFKLTSSTGADMIRYGATALQLNSWYYITGVYNATSQTMDVYLNGVLDDGALLGTITSSQENSTTNVNIGRRAGTLDSFNGLIDEVRIYGRALSPAEVQTDLNTPISVGWTTFFQGIGRTGFNSSENTLTATSAASLHLAWKTSDSGQPERGVFSQPIVANGTVYWGSFDGYERATDRSGHPLWQTFIGHTNDPTCDDPPSAGVVSTATFRSDVPVAGATSVLYVGGGDTKVYALNAATGAVLWSQSVGANPDHFIWSSPVVFGNSVYIGVSSFGDCPLVQGQLVQLDRVTGAVQNTFNTVPNGCIGAGVWSSPTIDAAAGTIYFATGNDGACASAEPLAPAIVEVKASDLSLVGSWQVPPAEQGADSDFGSTPTLFNGVIGGQSRSLVGAINKNGVFYAFTRDALGSGPVWRTRIAVGGGDPNFGTADVSVAAYDGSTLYVGGGNTTIGSQSCSGTVNALNPSTGAFAWRHCLTDGGWVLGGVTAAGGIVTVGEGNNVAVFSAATGASLFTFTGTGLFFGTPSIANGTLYAGDLAGNLYALTT